MIDDINPERDARDAAVLAWLPHVPLYGWSPAAMRRVLADNADLLFTDTVSVIAAHSDWADRTMEQAALAAGMPGLRLPDRVRAVIAIRLRQNRSYKDAIGRGLTHLLLPGRKPDLLRILGRTVDTIWHAAGDQSADFSWYTKRAILSAIYGATLLYWLRDDSQEDEATLEFLDRRLADVAKFGKLRKRLSFKMHTSEAV